MKVTVVPAQITTIEDRIAGNLGLSQLLLFAAPVFGGSALYIILPPSMHSAAYKLVAMTILFFICGVLAIRIKGKILLFWLVIILRFNIRPRYYLFNKNSLAHREQYETSHAAPQAEAQGEPVASRRSTTKLSTAEVAHLQSIVENPAANLSFITRRKGGLHVLITEIQDQN